MKKYKKVERRWVNGFLKSDFVKEGSFYQGFAKSIFRGQGVLPDSVSVYSGGFRTYANNIDDTLEYKKGLLKFLSLAGISISLDKLNQFILDGNEIKDIVRRVHYIFKTLFYANEKFNVNDPFNNNYGDINYLLRIEIGNDYSESNPQLFDDISLKELYNNYSKLPDNYEEDEVVKNLFERIENSNESVFLTGKAGTGKSTFVHYFTTKTKKKTLLLSFTGIAAVNIGGQTIHSFFRLPFKPLLPRDKEITKFKDHWNNKKIVENVDTIVIDEVSMLRSDILEAIDYSLRINGGNPDLPFGGKQMVFIGDVYQLPPIVTSDSIEQELFKSIYTSEYFFDAPSFQTLNPIKIQLTKVHRQKDSVFIETLNKVRDYSIIQSEVDDINDKCLRNGIGEGNELEIMLTSNRFIARTENIKRLESLPNLSFIFNANITGEFNSDRFPAPINLELKRNSQIMFVKNDNSIDKRRWVNGSIATIEFLSDELIEVKLKDGSIHEIKKEVWENRKFKWDKIKGEITSEVIGTFAQFPIKLAWAITIHKSQGLTFDNVKIDLGTGTFANGQLYTALSRCKSMEGLSLVRRIKLTDIIKDHRISDFNMLINQDQELLVHV